MIFFTFFKGSQTVAAFTRLIRSRKQGNISRRNRISFLNLETLEGTQMKKFLNDESGAVTVDFVVLTAGAVLIAVGVGTTLAGKVSTAIGAISL